MEAVYANNFQCITSVYSNNEDLAYNEYVFANVYQYYVSDFYQFASNSWRLSFYLKNIMHKLDGAWVSTVMDDDDDYLLSIPLEGCSVSNTQELYLEWKTYHLQIV